MQLERRPIAELRAAPYNPRTISPAALKGLAASIARWGIVEPVIENKRTGCIVGGHQRIRAAESLGHTEIDVVVVDLEEAEEKALNIALNSPSISGEFTEGLHALLDEVQAALPDLDPAMKLDDLRDLVKLPPSEADDAEDPVPAAPVKPFSRLGDTWLLGTSRLAVGDARQEGTLARALGAGARAGVLTEPVADCVFTDPPYGVDYEGKTADAMRIQNDGFAGLEELLRTVLGDAAAASRDGAAWFICAPAGPQSLAFSKVLTELGVWRQTLVWAKDAFVLGHSDYHYRHEVIYYGWKPGAAHRAPAGRTHDTVWEIPRPRASREHPTMKPVPLIARALANHTAPNELVLDPFAGSGSTLVACATMHRRFAGAEIEPRFADVAVLRWMTATKLKPRLERDGRILEWADLSASFATAPDAGGGSSASAQPALAGGAA